MPMGDQKTQGSQITMRYSDKRNKEAISPKILSNAFVKESTSKVTGDSSGDLKYKNIIK